MEVNISAVLGVFVAFYLIIVVLITLQNIDVERGE
jgi:hypothetical protein